MPSSDPAGRMTPQVELRLQNAREWARHLRNKQRLVTVRVILVGFNPVQRLLQGVRSREVEGSRRSACQASQTVPLYCTTSSISSLQHRLMKCESLTRNRNGKLLSVISHFEERPQSAGIKGTADETSLGDRKCASHDILSLIKLNAHLFAEKPISSNCCRTSVLTLGGICGHKKLLQFIPFVSSLTPSMWCHPKS